MPDFEGVYWSTWYFAHCYVSLVQMVWTQKYIESCLTLMDLVDLVDISSFSTMLGERFDDIPCNIPTH